MTDLDLGLCIPMHYRSKLGLDFSIKPPAVSKCNPFLFNTQIQHLLRISAEYSNTKDPTILTRSEAIALHKAILTGEEVTSKGEGFSIPHRYGILHCQLRVQYAVEKYKSYGYQQARKIFVVSGNENNPGLRVPTNNAGDIENQGGIPEYKWWYHVALLVRVQDENGMVTDQVIDPSLSKEGPIGITKWIALMNKENKFPQVEANKVLGKFPTGNYYIITPASVFSPSQTEFEDENFAEKCYQKGCEYTKDEWRIVPGKDLLWQDTKRLKIHEIAAQLRGIIQNNKPIEEAGLRFSKASAVIRELPSNVKQTFLEEFPNLVNIEMKRYFGKNNIFHREFLKILTK